jgi:peptide deformylase
LAVLASAGPVGPSACLSPARTMLPMAPYRIRTFGDPVLKRRAAEVSEIDGRIARLAEDMHVTMKEAHGLGLAAPQVGVSRRLFVYEIGDSGPQTLVNPVISEREGEWEHEEGCLSVPQLFFWVQRPIRVHVTGYDLDGREVSIEAEELEATLYQHEVDHLDGKLLLELLDDDQRKQAMRELRQRAVEEEQAARNGMGAAAQK